MKRLNWTPKKGRLGCSDIYVFQLGDFEVQNVNIVNYYGYNQIGQYMLGVTFQCQWPSDHLYKPRTEALDA